MANVIESYEFQSEGCTYTARMDVNRINSISLNPLVSPTVMSGKDAEVALLDRLCEYYNQNPNAFRVMIDVVRGSSVNSALCNGFDSIPESNISLRMIDFFVTSYTKMANQHGAIIQSHCQIDDVQYRRNLNEIRELDTYGLYRRELQFYNKRLFDPFARVIRSGGVRKLNLYYNLQHFTRGADEVHCLSTTAAQLNFFRWFTENDLMPLIRKNMRFIRIQIKIKDEQKRARAEARKFDDLNMGTDGGSMENERLREQKNSLDVPTRCAIREACRKDCNTTLTDIKKPVLTVFFS